MAPTRAQEWEKAKAFVGTHHDELAALPSPAAIFQYCEKNKHTGKTLWPKIKTELRKQCGVDLDQLRADAAQAVADQARTLAASASDAQIVEFYAAAELIEKPSRADPDEIEIVPMFAITDRAGNPVWYNSVHPNDRDKITSELAAAEDAACKAVWLAGQVRDDQGLDMVRVIIHHNHPGLDPDMLARIGVKHLAAIELIHVDDPADNPATTICLDGHGYRDWHEHVLSDLLVAADTAPAGR